jgi:hypothetical protein
MMPFASTIDAVLAQLALAAGFRLDLFHHLIALESTEGNLP